MVSLRNVVTIFIKKSFPNNIFFFVCTITYVPAFPTGVNIFERLKDGMIEVEGGVFCPVVVGSGGGVI